MHPPIFRCAVCLLLVSLAAGCGPAGPKLLSVSGTVTFNGAPVNEGYISFEPLDGKSASGGGPIVAGKFQGQTSAGKNRVRISATREAGPVDPVMGQAPRVPYIPAQYNDQSTLEIDVQPNKTTFPFDLQGEALAP